MGCWAVDPIAIVRTIFMYIYIHTHDVLSSLVSLCLNVIKTPPRRLGRVIDVDDTVARDASSKTHPADADDVNLLFGSIILLLLYYIRVYYNMYTAMENATGPSVTCPL